MDDPNTGRRHRNSTPPEQVVPTQSSPRNRPAAELILPPPPPIEQLDENTPAVVYSSDDEEIPSTSDGHQPPVASTIYSKSLKKRKSSTKPEYPTNSPRNPSTISQTTANPTSVPTNRLPPLRPSCIKQMVSRRPPNPLLNADLIVFNHSAGRCNVCLVQYCSSYFPVPPTPLLQCCGCRLAFYCSAAHQRADWSTHKQMCRAVRDILQRREMDHLYEINGDTRFASRRKFTQTRAMVLREVELELQRPLRAAEQSQVAWPKMCNICFRYDASKLDSCKFCHAAWFCIVDRHTDSNMIKTHPSEQCQQLRLHYSIVVVGEQRNIIPPEPLRRWNPAEPFPANLFHLVNHSARTQICANPKNDAQNADFTTVCNFSYVATLISAIRHAEVLYDTQQELIVHIVGAKSEITMFTRHECWLLFRWLPHTTRRIELVFVGPELPEGLAPYRDHMYGQLRCRLRFFRMRYEYYRQTKKTPHLCICYNSGFCERARALGGNPWTAAVNRMLSVCTKIAFTSYLSVEAEADTKWMGVLATAHVKLPFVWQRLNRRNEYRDFRPHRNADMDVKDTEEFYYCNSYMCVMTLSTRPS